MHNPKTQLQSPSEQQRSGSLMGLKVSLVLGGVLWWRLLSGRQKLALLSSLMLSLLLLSAGIVGWRWFKANAVPNVSVYQIGDKRPVNLTIGGGGIIYPLQQLNVSYPAIQHVVTVNVKAGDHVNANQPLISFDPAEANITIKRAADDLAAAQSYLSAVSGRSDPVTIAHAQHVYDVAKNKYDELQARTSSPLSSNGALVAPIAGIVSQVNVVPGEIFGANTTLLTIKDISTVEIHVQVPLSYLGQIRLNQKARITIANDASSFDGIVNNIVPHADAQTDTFEVWASIPNKDMKFLPGMSAFVTIEASITAFAVPRLAVLSAESDAAVFVVRNQVAHLQPVRLVGRSVDTIYVMGNISPGDRVVLVGLDTLRDGQRVHIT